MTDLAAILTVRESAPSDRAYIIRTWLETYRSSPVAKTLGEAGYQLGWRHVVSDVLDRPTTRVLVAATRVDDAVLAGFLAYAPVEGDMPATIHYAAVRNDWRRQGVARMLLNAAVISEHAVYTHTAQHGIPVPRGWRFRPDHAACTAYLRELSQRAGDTEASAVLRGLSASLDAMVYAMRRREERFRSA